MNGLFIVVVMWIVHTYPDHSTSKQKVVKAVRDTKEVCSVVKGHTDEYKTYKVIMLPGLNDPVVKPIEVYCESK